MYVCSCVILSCHSGDTGLRGPIGQAGMPGTKVEQGNLYCSVSYNFACIFVNTWYKRRQGYKSSVQ